MCSGTCGRARRRRRERARVAAGRVNGRVRTRLVAEGGVVAAERERERLAKRASKDVDADWIVAIESVNALFTELHFKAEPGLGDMARLGGRIQKLARRLLARARYLELYGEAP